jgi:polysaccharide biosynthesis protein PslH
MRILLLTQVVPYPPDSGPKIKTYNVLRFLARRHDVHLVSFVRSPAEEHHARQLDDICASVTTVPIRRSRRSDVAYLARSLMTQRPFLVERDDSVAMRRALRELIAAEGIDAVHADQLTMAQFAVDLPVPLRVLDEHNAVWTIVRRAASRSPWFVRLAAELEWRKLRAYEAAVCRQFDRVTVVSQDDRLALSSADSAGIPATVIPIAVDTTALEFMPRTNAARHILSVATMFYPPNAEGIIWFAEHVFPRVQAALAGTHFSVVGSRPTPRVIDLANANPDIKVTGYVADLDPLLRQSGVMVVPVHSGSGMRVKILEGFARGIPIVSTRVGVEGIDAQHEKHLLVADDPGEFADAVLRILREPETTARLARAGRELVESRYDWRSALGGLDEIYPIAGLPRVEQTAGAAG